MAGSSGSLYTAFIDIGLKGLDKVDKYMKDAVSSVQNHMGRIGEIFTQSDGAIKSFVGAANPLAMNTFGASVELLKARIGQSFTPYILQASKAIQDLGNWIKNIDPETKKSIANWVMYGTAAAGAFAVISKGIGLLGVLAKNPVAVALIAASAVIIKLTQDIEKLNKSMDNSIDKMERMKKGVYTEKEYKGSAAEAIEQSDQSNANKLFDARLARNKIELEGRLAAVDGGNRTRLGNDIDNVKERMGFANVTNDSARKVQSSMKDLGMIDDLIARLEKGAGGPKFTDEKDLPKKKGGNNGFMLGAMGGGQGGGGSMSLDSAYGRLNAGALGQNEIQREMMKIQQESLVETRETAKDTSSIVDLLKNAVGL